MLSSTVSKEVYDIENVPVPISTGYEIPFRIFEAADVHVTIALDTGENNEITTGFSVSIPVSDTGVCKVIFDEDYEFPEGAIKLVISRTVPAVQDKDLRNGDDFDADTLEEMFDRQVAILQEHNETLNRTFKLPISEDPSDLGFPSASARAGKIIGFDETGDGVEMYPDPTGTITTAQELINAANTAINEANTANAIAQQTAEEAAESAERCEQLADQFDTEAINDRLDGIDEEIEEMKQSNMLPLPICKLVVNELGDSGIISFGRDWEGYGNVIIVVKNGSAPASAVDGTAVLDIEEGFAVSDAGTYYIRAFPGEDNVMKASSSAMIEFTPMVMTPEISFQDDTKTITITTVTAGAVIRYTLDGTEPTASNGSVYSAPFVLTLNATVRAKAFKDGYTDSSISELYCKVACIFAVRWDYSVNPPVLTRLTPSTDPLSLVTETILTAPIISTASEAGGSPFDQYAPWNGMKRRNFVLDEESSAYIPGPWEGEEGYSTSANDTMVWIPKFWVKVVEDAIYDQRTYYISDSEYQGFMLHPGSGQYVGAYVTSSNKESKSGKSFTTNQTIVAMRTNAKTKGAGWGLIDIAERSALQYLFIVEFANWNSQGLFGQTSGTQNGTGMSDAILGHTGYNGKVKYRHVEDLWNGVQEWTDGFNTVNGHHYVSTNRDTYQSDVTTGYTDLGTWACSGYITKLKYFEDMPWLIGIPEADGGSSTTFVPDDAALVASSNFVLHCGGNWGSSESYGLFRFHAGATSSNTHTNYGSRLSYKEPDADAS